MCATSAIAEQRAQKLGHAARESTFDAYVEERVRVDKRVRVDINAGLVFLEILRAQVLVKKVEVAEVRAFIGFCTPRESVTA